MGVGIPKGPCQGDSGKIKWSHKFDSTESISGIVALCNGIKTEHKFWSRVCNINFSPIRTIESFCCCSE